jgi:hypothetical protein
MAKIGPNSPDFEKIQIGIQIVIFL